MALNRYQKLLQEKSKGTTTIDNESKESSSKHSIPFFNPNKLISSNPNLTVRVLPNKKGMFFYQFKKHSFKMGSWKNAFCMKSRTGDGEPVSDSCIFCEFINENGKELSKEANYAFKAKDSYMILVYNPISDEVQKYEFNEYGLIDILTSIDKLGENFNPDIDGFDLKFKKDGNYSKIDKAILPSMTIDEIMEESNNFKEIPDLESEVIPSAKNRKNTEKYIESLFELAIEAFAPQFSYVKPSNKSLNQENEDNDDLPEDMIDDNIDDQKEEDHPTKINSIKEVVKTEDSDDGVEDLRSFLSQRRR